MSMVVIEQTGTEQTKNKRRRASNQGTPQGETRSAKRTRFEENPVLSTMLKELFQRCQALERNDLLTIETLREVIQCEPHEDHWPDMIARLKRKMEAERGIVLFAEYGKGYILMTKDDQLTLYPAIRRRRAKKHLGLALRGVASIPTAHLSDHQRKVQEAQVNGLKAAQVKIAEHDKYMREYLAPRGDRMPRVPFN